MSKEIQLPPQAAFFSPDSPFLYNGKSDNGRVLQNGHVEQGELITVGDVEVIIGSDFSELKVTAITSEGVYEKEACTDPVRLEHVFTNYYMVSVRMFDTPHKAPAGGQFVDNRPPVHILEGLSDKPLTLMGNEKANVGEQEVVVIKLWHEADKRDAYYITGVFNILLNENFEFVKGVPYSTLPWGAGINGRVEREKPIQGYTSSVPLDRKITKLH